MLAMYNVHKGEVVYCQKRYVLCATYSSSHRAAQTQEDRKKLEKSVSKVDIFRLVASESREIFIARMTTFGAKFPNAMAYLEAIPPSRWVHYAQIEAKYQHLGGDPTTLVKLGKEMCSKDFANAILWILSPSCCKKQTQSLRRRLQNTSFGMHRITSTRRVI
jgi:hypothetical protein